ncbi:hypothetical protein V5O48_004382 [Marasmius crinis-equi]|uniref:Uncharacterized protein n=1 Tax=Marasmius crinis-equi TaxID=585013 RepID=A0ABR3FQM1_9AGAR
MSTPSPQQFNVDNTLGVMLIGFVVSVYMFGVMTSATISYFSRFPRDRLVYKVSIIEDAQAPTGRTFHHRLLDFAHQICMAHVIYTYAITYYGNLNAYFENDMVPTLSVQVLLGAMLGTCVKLYFATHIWRLSKGNFLSTGAVAILGLLHFPLGLVYSIESLRVKKFIYVEKVRVRFLPNLNYVATKRDHAYTLLQTIGTTALAVGTAADVLTAMVLCYYLRELRPAPVGSKRIIQILDKFIIYGVNTGAATGCLIYGVSMMCTLNSRVLARGQGASSNGSGSRSRALAMFSSTRSAAGKPPGRGGRSVAISVTTTVDYDERHENNAARKARMHDKDFGRLDGESDINVRPAGVAV